MDEVERRLSRLELVEESHRREHASAESDVSGFAQPASPTPALQAEHAKAEPAASESGHVQRPVFP
jgi:hypothetical protein